MLHIDSPAPCVERYYQAVKSFILNPVPIPPQHHLHKFTFCIPAMIRARVCQVEILPGESLPVSPFSNGSLLVRIRCCYLERPAAPIADVDWLAIDTAWPEHIFIEVNGKPMGIRRKAHYAKDLPIDISASVVSGDNFMKIAILPGNTTNNRQPFIAVELLEILSHRAIMHIIKEKGVISADKTQNMIKKRLAGSSKHNDDDRLAIVNKTLSIGLADPFAFSTFSVPVRGKACTHFECFDLETWLNSRPGKMSICVCGNGFGCERCKEPSFADKWGCPLCGGDARPCSLRMDGFLAEVRAKLEKDNKLRTKSILVSADGTWKPKEQASDDGGDMGSNDDGSAFTSATL